MSSLRLKHFGLFEGMGEKVEKKKPNFLFFIFLFFLFLINLEGKRGERKCRGKVSMGPTNFYLFFISPPNP